MHDHRPGDAEPEPEPIPLDVTIAITVTFGLPVSNGHTVSESIGKSEPDSYW